VNGTFEDGTFEDGCYLGPKKTYPTFVPQMFRPQMSRPQMARSQISRPQIDILKCLILKCSSSTVATPIPNLRDRILTNFYIVFSPLSGGIIRVNRLMPTRKAYINPSV
jgi:hypothetical protein